MRMVVRAAAAGAVLAMAAQASAQDDQWAGQIEQLLQETVKLFADRGYHYGGFTHAGSLDASATENLAVTLAGGRQAFIVGVCDTRCSNLDLTLVDAAGNAVDADTAADDSPLVGMRPASDGTYTVRVTMTACASGPCRYAVRHFVE